MPFDKNNAKEFGKKSADVRKQRRESMKKMSVREVMLQLLENPDNKEQLCKGLIESAAKGNAKSAELLLKIIGEDPNKPQTSDDSDPFK
ncbi:hypothetical protein [Pseudobutyrivibrio sp.]|uniref:hypothetical protein n=1 Tax=Pseudobutyrivibrio sp. TaxID=2014367 RepID=UPI00386AAC2C